MDNLDMEKSSYGTLERIIYIFLLPILFTVVLTGVLLTLFDYNVKNTVYKIGREIPIIRHIVPADDSGISAGTNPTNKIIQNEQQIDNLSASLNERDQQIEKLLSDLAAKDQSIATLENSVQKLVLDQEATVANIETYRKQLKQLAEMYSNMTASKAAPILENLTMPELVLVLYEMEASQRGRILEKMNPKTAADASIQLKDINDSNRADYEAQAAKAREERGRMDDPNAKVELTQSELAQTLAAMTPQSAAVLIIELNKTNASKAVAILSSMESAARSRLLTAITNTSPEDAASLIGKLGQ